MTRKVFLFVVIFLIGCQTPVFSNPAVQTTGPVGYIGCSNSRQTVEGYTRVGGARIWAYDAQHAQQYGGGTVTRWFEGVEQSNDFWKIFDMLLAKQPDTKVVWWQLCIRQSEDPTYAQAVAVLDAVRKRIPGVTVYVSSLPAYRDNVCSITGVEGVQRAQALTKQLADAEEDVLPGPVLTQMTRAELENDGCHMVIAGRERVGTELKAFFDG